VPPPQGPFNAANDSSTTAGRRTKVYLSVRTEITIKTALLTDSPANLLARHLDSDSVRKRHRLLERIHRIYETVTEDRQIGSGIISFTRIKDPDRVLDLVVEECDRTERLTGVRLEDPQHLPYWAELWDSAGGIGQVLIEDLAATDRPPRTLDLGCGMGLTGSIAAALGCPVLFGDIETPALLFARLNSLPWSERVRTRRINWQSDDLGEQFDLIIGADILYERKQWEFLDAFWRRHLAPGGELLLGEPGRQTGDTFLEWAPARGWRLERRDLKVPTREAPVRVLRLQRR